jgi:DNA (cytosine-5)-methyltransferase 1
MKIFYIDLFSGAGGTTTGVHLAGPNIQVAACVNHDSKAIESHKANHPNCIHFIEDVRDMKVVRHISALCRNIRKDNPGCVINLWASLECTNYSKAKGGQPRDADSRTLAYSLYDYLEGVDYDYVFIENVREFMSWGPLDEYGRPVSRKNGIDYVRWIKKMTAFGYRYDWKILNSADFGAYTSRERYFGQFAKTGLSISWPQPTHSKNIESGGLFENQLKPWKPVREVLDLKDEGESIFSRKKPLVEATLRRIYAGLLKFVDGEKISDCMLTSYYGNSNSAQSVDRPCPTITTKDRFSAVFIDQPFGTGKPTSINKPAGTLTAIPKFNLVRCQWLMNPQFSDKGRDLSRPCFTLIAKMDKRPPYLISPKKGTPITKIKSSDSPVMREIKAFMNKNGIADIKMRMLKVPELLRIQGFPDDYILKGTQGDKKKFIGNSVVPVVAKSIAQGNAKVLINENQKIDTVA